MDALNKYAYDVIKTQVMEHVESLKEGQEANFEKLKSDFVIVLEKNSMTKAPANAETIAPTNGRKMLADRKEVSLLSNALKKDESEIRVTSLLTDMKSPARRKTSKLNVVDDVEDSDKDGKRKKGAVESRQSHNLEVDN